MVSFRYPYPRFDRLLPCGKQARAELVAVICRNGVRQYRLLCCDEHGLDNHNIAYRKLTSTERENARVHHSNAADGVEPLPL